jgi:hypothetical protein
MPQPFQNLLMQQLQSFSKEDFMKQLQTPAMPPNEVHVAQKIATLAHFLVQNFRDELSSEEHVIDTAIRLLQPLAKLHIEPKLNECDATKPTNEQNHDNQIT